MGRASVAAHFREQAAKTRALAESAKGPTTLQQLLDLAADYEKLAELAEQREAGRGSPSDSD